MRARSCLLLAAATLAAAACAATPEPLPLSAVATSDGGDAPRIRQELTPKGAYTHAASGMTFPEAVGAFRRTSVARYRPDGSEESAGYDFRDSSGGFIFVDVYVYPSPDLAAAAGAAEPRRQQCESQFIEAFGEVVIPDILARRSHEVVSRGEITLTRGDGEYDGLMAEVLSSGPVAVVDADGAVELQPESVHLFCYLGGRWSVKFRMFYPPGFDASAALEPFMTELMATIGAQERDGASGAERATPALQDAAASDPAKAARSSGPLSATP